MKDEVDVLGSPSLIVLTMSSVDVKLCESRGGRPGLPVPNSPYGFCGRKAALIKLTKVSRCLHKLGQIVCFWMLSPQRSR